MSASKNIQNWATQSPWLDKSKSNLFRDEFQIAKENLSYPGYRPMPIYNWIYRNKGKKKFFQALARYAPMFPVRAYRGQIASWISPPPSGLGNVIFIVMGHNRDGQLRVVGGNYFTYPTSRSGEVPLAGDFFYQYDAVDEKRQQYLVRNVIENSMNSSDDDLVDCVLRQCEHFHTMPICIIALTNRGPLFHAAKAVIEGDKPADFSYEIFGEIK